MQVVGSVSKKISGVSAQRVFELWADINNWHKFNHGIEYAELKGDFKVGNNFTMCLKNKKTVKIKIHEIVKDKKFVDLTVFPFAKMYGEHEIIEKNGALVLVHTIKISGLLSNLWKRLVAQKVADKLQDDMESFIKLAQSGK